MPAPAPDTDPRSDTELAAEQAHLAESRAQLARMRERTASMDSAAAGDWVSREYLESTFALRMKQLADDPTIPLFFGRVDYARRRGLPHRPPPRLRRDRRPDGGRLAGAGQPAVLPGQPRPSRWASGCAGGTGSSTGRLTAYEDERPGRRRARSEHSAILEAEIERPRVGPDARHRRHHPARAGRDRPRRPVPHDLRAGRARHRQDRGRAAPRGVPALRAPRAARPARACWWSGRTRASCATSATCCPRSARSTQADHDRGAGRPRPSPTSTPRDDPRHRRRRRRARSRATPGWPRCCARAVWSHVGAADGGAGRAAGRAPLAGAGVRGRGDRGVAARPRGPVRRRPGDAAAVAGAPDPGARWSSPATPPTTGCRTRWPAASRSRTTRRSCGPRSTRPGCCCGCCPTPAFLAAAADGILDAGRAGGAAVGEAAALARRAPAGRWPTPSSSTRRPTWSTARRRWPTSWSTRRRTCRR